MRLATTFLARLSLTLPVLTGCASYGRPLPEIAPEINATLYTGPTLVEPGDVLDLRFARKGEWNQTARVRRDGCMSFPALGELRVAGLTVTDLEKSLDEKYRPILVEPALTLNVGEPAAAGVEGDAGILVTGQVGKPGRVGLRGENLTLVEVLALAGGHLEATALLGNTLMLRRSPQTGLYTAWRIDAREDFWASAEPVYLQRHDLVFVPNTPIDDANIWVDQYISKMLPVSLTSFGVGIVVGAQ
jgi:polysaccharide export outer membrane protein